MNKQLFKERQLDLLWMANTEAGRYLLGVTDSDPIVKLTPNAVIHRKDHKTFQGNFYCYERVSKILLPELAKMQIYEQECKKKIEDKHRALLHFSGLQKSKYLPSIYLTTTDYYAGAGDGTVWNYDLNFATSRDAATGYAATPSSATAYFFFGKDTAGAGGLGVNQFILARVFLPVDTSGIGAGQQVTAATIKIYPSADINNGGIAHATVVSTTQAATNTLVTADYDQIGGTALSDLVALDTSAYKTLTLTAGGLSAINMTGTTKLGLRDNDYDIGNSAPSVYYYASLYFSEQAATANDSYYSITYAAAPSSAFMMFM